MAVCAPLLQLLVTELQLFLQCLVSVPSKQPGAIVQIQLPVVKQPGTKNTEEWTEKIVHVDLTFTSAAIRNIKVEII